MKRLLKDQDGGATVEFILLAVPLIVPIALFLTTIDFRANQNYQVRNFSRQVARAYVSAPNESLALARVNTLSEIFSQQVFSTSRVELPPTISITCSANPCLTQGAEVSIEVALKDLAGREIARAKSIEDVDQWR